MLDHFSWGLEFHHGKIPIVLVYLVDMFHIYLLAILFDTLSKAPKDLFSIASIGIEFLDAIWIIFRLHLSLPESNMENSVMHNAFPPDVVLCTIYVCCRS